MKVFLSLIAFSLLSAGIAFLVVIQPGSSGVVASLRLPDGCEYMVTQRCNLSLEPYTIAFHMRPPGGKWGWCYMDHQANRWSKVALKYDANADVVTVTKHGIWQAALDRKLRTFAIGDGQSGRSVPAPQEERDPEFPFPR